MTYWKFIPVPADNNSDNNWICAYSH